jgi:hypothetical protein
MAAAMSHAARKMDIDGFSTRSDSLMNTGRGIRDRVVEETVSLTRANLLHEALHDHKKMPLNRLWVGPCNYRRPGNNFTQPPLHTCKV